MGTPNLQPVGQKYSWQPGTCNWLLKLGQSYGTEPLNLWNLTLTLGHQYKNWLVRHTVGVQRVGELGVQRVGEQRVGKSHTFGVRVP